MRTRTVTTATVLAGLAAALLIGPGTGAPASAASAPAVVDRTLSDTHIVESSSLTRSAFGKGVLWTANDSGGGPLLYAIGTNGSTVATYTVTNATNHDWEGMAAGSSGSSHFLVHRRHR